MWQKKIGFSIANSLSQNLINEGFTLNLLATSPIVKYLFSVALTFINQEIGSTTSFVLLILDTLKNLSRRNKNLLD